MVQRSTLGDGIRFWTEGNGVAAIDDAALAGHRAGSVYYAEADQPDGFST